MPSRSCRLLLMRCLGPTPPATACTPLETCAVWAAVTDAPALARVRRLSAGRVRWLRRCALICWEDWNPGRAAGNCLGCACAWPACSLPGTSQCMAGLPAAAGGACTATTACPLWSCPAWPSSSTRWDPQSAEHCCPPRLPACVANLLCRSCTPDVLAVGMRWAGAVHNMGCSLSSAPTVKSSCGAAASPALKLRLNPGSCPALPLPSRPNACCGAKCSLRATPA